jgi:hypothetical protein
VHLPEMQGTAIAKGSTRPTAPDAAIKPLGRSPVWARSGHSQLTEAPYTSRLPLFSRKFALVKP